MASPVQESPGKLPEGQPDPVIVGPGLKTMGEDAYEKASNVTPSLNVDKTAQLSSDTPSYFDKVHVNKDVTAQAVTAKPPSTPAEAAEGVQSGPELLRRLSLVGETTPKTPVDLRAAHPGLQLTGRIISAAFCIPYKLGFRSGADWV